MTELEKLARKAIEANKVFHDDMEKNDCDNPVYLDAMMETEMAFQKAAIPQAILTLIQEKREMEEALKEMEPELRSMIYEQYKGTLHYPDQQKRYKRDLNICDRARALTPGDTPTEDGPGKEAFR